MQIRMLKTESGSIDGIRVQQYEAGAEYDLSATPGHVELAEAFVAAGLAEAFVSAKSAEVAGKQAEPESSADVAAPAKPAKAKK